MHVPQPRYPHVIALSLALALSVPGLRAQDTKVDPNGTWKWSFTTPNGDAIDLAVKLKLDGDQLSGAFIGRDGAETPIKEAKLKENEVSFTVVRERNGNTFTMKYAGKITGDNLKGTVGFERDGETRTRDWVAKRSGASPAGTWKWSYTRDGQEILNVLKLKWDGEKLSGGVTTASGNETAITEAKFADGEVAFAVTRERDGTKFTAHYHGKLQGDTIDGKVEVNFNGEDHSFDWQPKRSKD